MRGLQVFDAIQSEPVDFSLLMPWLDEMSNQALALLNQENIGRINLYHVAFVYMYTDFLQVTGDDPRGQACAGLVAELKKWVEQTNKQKTFLAFCLSGLSKDTSAIPEPIRHDFNRYVSFIRDIPELIKQLPVDGETVPKIKTLLQQMHSKAGILSTLLDEEIKQHCRSVYYPQPMPEGYVQSFLEAFHLSVKRVPSQVALVDMDRGLSLTYTQLDELISQMAANISRILDISATRQVGVYFSHSMEVVIALLAIWKAGGVYVPLTQDHRISAEQLEHIVVESQVALILMNKQSQRQYFSATWSQVHHGKVVLADLKRQQGHYSIVYVYSSEIEQKVAQNSPLKPFQNPSATDLAYIIYSSGSSGRPKGIQVTHGGLYFPMRAHHELLSITPESRVPLYTDVSFDPFIMEVMMTLGTTEAGGRQLGGGCLFVVSSEVKKNAEKLASFYIKHQLTVAILTPSILKKLNPKQFSHLKSVISMGERLSEDVFNLWKSASPSLQFINGYGPSEVTICSSLGVCEDQHVLSAGPIIAGLQPLILPLHFDNNLPQNVEKSSDISPFTREDAQAYAIPVVQAVDDVREGELFLAGPGVSPGYIGKAGEQLNAGRFFPELYVIEHGGIRLYRNVYRTCDYVRMQSGSLYPLGRLDCVVKIRGVLVDLEFIETSIKTISGVKACKVTYDLDKNQLVAIVQLNQGVSFDQQALSRQLSGISGVTSEHMPQQWQCEHLSETTSISGKKKHRKTETVRAKTPEEETLSKQWCDILREKCTEDSLQFNSNFYEIGGDSYELALLAGKLNVELSDLKNYLTLSAMARYLSYKELFSSHTLKLEEVCDRVGGKSKKKKANRHTDQIKNVPIFLIPSMFGEVKADESYLKYGEALSKEGYLVYALKAMGLSQSTLIAESVEEYAVQYETIMSSVLGKGVENLSSCVLIAYSSGCSIAYELAARLEQKSVQVYLILVDGLAPSKLRAMSAKDHADYLINNKIIEAIQAYSKVQIKKEDLKESVQECSQSVDQIQFVFREFISQAKKKDQLQRLNVVQSIMLAHYLYRPVYQVTHAKILCTESLGWAIGRSRIHQVQHGRHASIFKDDLEGDKKILEWCEEAYQNLLFKPLCQQEKTYYLESYKNMYVLGISGAPKKSVSMEEGFVPLSLLSYAAQQSRVSTEGFSGIFSESTKKILVVGAPNTGKSTLCQYSVYQWAKGSLWHTEGTSQFSVVLYFTFEELQKNLEKKKQLEAYCTQHGKHYENSLLIVDGYHSSFACSDHVVRLLEKSRSYVLVTSRFVIDGFAHLFSGAQLWILQGFAAEQQERYIKKHLPLSSVFCEKREVIYRAINKALDGVRAHNMLLCTPEYLHLLCAHLSPLSDDDLLQEEDCWETFIDWHEAADRFVKNCRETYKTLPSESASARLEMAHFFNLVSYIAYKTYQCQEVSRSHIEAIISEYFRVHQVQSELSVLLQDILDLGVIEGAPDAMGTYTQFKFRDQKLQEYLVVQYLDQHLTEDNYQAQYGHCAALIHQFRNLYLRLGNSQGNDFLNALLATTPIKTGPSDLARRICIKSLESRPQNIEDSPLYQLLLQQVGEGGKRTITKEVNQALKRSEGERLNFNSIITAIYEYKPSISVYLRKADNFFIGKMICLSHASGFIVGEIVSFERKKDDKVIEISLKNRSKLLFYLLQGKITKVKSIQERSNDLLSFLREAAYSEGKHVFVLASDVNVLEMAGSVVSSSLFSSKRKEGVAMVFWPAGQYEVRRVQVLKNTVEYEVRGNNKRYPIVLKTTDTAEITEYGVEAHNKKKRLLFDRVGLQSIRVNWQFSTTLEGVTSKNYESKITVREKIPDENDIKLKKYEEMESLKDIVSRKFFEAPEGLLVLNRVLVNLAHNELQFISDTLIAETELELGIGQVLNHIITLAKEIQQDFSKSQVLIDIIKNVNHARVLEQDSSLVVAKTMQLLQEAFQEIQKIEDKKSILFFGVTGSGKTTGLNAYLGLNLLSTTGEYGQPMVKLKDNKATVTVVDEEGEECEMPLQRDQYGEIGHSICVSGTPFVRAYPLILKHGIEDADSIRLCDFPGFMDTGGQSYDLSTCLSIDQAIAKSAAVKAIVLFVPYHQLADRANNHAVIDLFNRLFGVLPQVREEINLAADKRITLESVFLVVTKHAHSGVQQRMTQLIASMVDEEVKAAQAENARNDFSSSADRVAVWKIIQYLDFSGRLNCIDFNSTDANRQILKTMSSVPDIPKQKFVKTMDSPIMREKFPQLIQASMDAWRGCYERYSDLLNKIESKRKEYAKEQTNIEEVEKLIQEGQLQLTGFIKEKANLNATLEKINQLLSMNAEGTDLGTDYYDDEQVADIKNIIAANLEQQLANDKAMLRNSETEYSKANQKLADLSSAMQSYDDQIAGSNAQVEVLKQEIRALETDESYDVLWQYPQHAPEDQFSIVTIREGQRQAAFEENRETGPQDYVPNSSRTVTARDYRGNLYHSRKIHRDYCLVPEDPNEREEFIRVRNPQFARGNYLAEVSGTACKFDLGKMAGESGNSVLYSLVTHWGTDQGIPHFTVRHRVNPLRRNQVSIAEKNRQIGTLEQQITQFQKEKAEKKIEQQKCQEEQESLQAKINLRKADIESSRTTVIANTLAAQRTATERLLQQNGATTLAQIEAIAQQKKRIADCRHRQQIAQIAEQQLQRVCLYYAVTMRLESDTPILLRKLAQLLLEGDDIGSGLLAAKDFLSQVQAYATYYDKNVRRLLADAESVIKEVNKLQPPMKEDLPFVTGQSSAERNSSVMTVGVVSQNVVSLAENRFRLGADSQGQRDAVAAADVEDQEPRLPVMF